MTIPLGGKIRDGSCKAPGTCQFMLSAIDASSAAENRRVYFAATALHIFMEEGVVEDLDTGRLTEQDYLQRLNQVQENFEAPRLRAKRLNVNPPSPLNESLALRLTDPPLYAYRTHADRYCDFMSDLILLEFFSDTVNKVMTIPELHDHCNFNWVTELTRDDINNGMLDLDRPENERRNPPILLAHNRRLRVTEMRDSPDFSQIGYQLAFVVEQGYVTLVKVYLNLLKY